MTQQLFMPWRQISITCEAAELEQVEQLLLDLGALSISLGDARDDPIYEPLPGDSPVWQHSIVTGMFEAGVDHEALYQQVVQRLPQQLVSQVSQHQLQDEDWEQAYRQHFGPIHCASDLWIVPSWCEAPDPAATNVRLDPGMAFGTGTHPTTALCLAWLGDQDIVDCSLVDYGCGSGILAIAACKLGARRVFAVDIDPQALKASESNARANQIGDEHIKISLPEAMPSDPVDLLMANILSGPLIDFAPRFASLVRPKGKILLSGILKTQLEEIQLAYRPYFELDQPSFREDWVRVSGIRNHV